MDRLKRVASAKISNYCTFHLSGDLDQTLQGRVGQVMNTFEDSHIFTTMSDTETECLQQELEEKRAATKLATQQAEELRLCNELEAESLKHQQWELAIEQLKKKREEISVQHQKQMEEMKAMAVEQVEGNPKEGAVAWLKEQLKKLGEPVPEPGPTEAEEKAQKEWERKQALIAHIKKQQEDLAMKLAELTEEKTSPSTGENKHI